MVRIDQLVVDLPSRSLTLEASDQLFRGARLPEGTLGDGEQAFVLGRLDDLRRAAGIPTERFEVHGEGDTDAPTYTIRALLDDGKGAPVAVDGLPARARASVLEGLTDVMETVYTLLEMPS